MRLNVFLPVILCLIIGNLHAQSSRPFPDRASNPRYAKARMEKRLDVFSERSFESFFSVEAFHGLTNTFSKDVTRTISAPLSVGINYRFSPVFSMGLFAGRSNYASEMNYFDKRYTTATETRSQIFSLRLNAHFPVGLRGEAYGGLGLGHRSTDITATEEPLNPEVDNEPIVRPQNGFLSTAHIGMRYSLSPRVGLQGEISSGISLLNVGISYRLR